MNGRSIAIQLLNPVATRNSLPVLTIKVYSIVPCGKSLYLRISEMSNAQVCHVLERCIVGTPLRDGVTSWLESMFQGHRLLPLAMQGICAQERHSLTRQLHNAAQRLFAT